MEMQPPQAGRCPFHAQSSSFQSQNPINVDEIEKLPSKPVSRRALLKMGGAAALTATTLAALSESAWMPKRVHAMPATNYYPDTQFDIGAFVNPAQTIAGVLVDFGVIYTFQAPATLTRNPTLNDQSILSKALATIEANYAFSPSGIFTFVAYGLPYFNRLPGSIVASHMPRLSFDQSRFVLEEAVPGPTDFGVPGITKRFFKVPVQIERNDILFIMRSDSLANITDVSNWLKGSNTLNSQSIPSPSFNGLFNFQPTRLNFVQPGLTRKTADNLSAKGVAPFSTIARQINPASSMWMGFIDQQVNASAPHGSNVIFAAANAGGSIGKLTTAVSGDYFDHGSIIHLSHIINDLQQFYNKDPNFTTSVEPFSERVQYMFSSFKPDGTPGLPAPQDPNDPFTNGGGLGAPTGDLSTQQQTAFVPNTFLGTNAMANNFDPDVLVQPVNPHKKYRVGHNLGLQRSSRAADGTPLHIRNDGPGLSSLDVPDGSSQPTLEFMIFVPTAEFFRTMRINSASLDYVKAGDNGGTATSVPAGIEAADSDDAGLERFLTATRRQNFLIPPRRHRSFPLLEITPADIQINPGGPAVSPFVADTDFTGGTAVTHANTIDTSGVTNPAPQAVYQSSRFGNFSYSIPGLTAGKPYTVRLHFAEIYWTAAGQRTFNVSINSQQVLTNFDILGTAGAANKAVVEQFTATADSTGKITLQFTTVKDNAQVNGIEILS